MMKVHGPHVFREMAIFQQQQKRYCWHPGRFFFNCDFIDTSVNSFVVPLASFSSAVERFADFSNLYAKRSSEMVVPWLFSL